MFILRVERTIHLLHLHVDLDVLSLSHHVPIHILSQLQVESLTRRNLLIVASDHVRGSVVPCIACCPHIRTLDVGIALRL